MWESQAEKCCVNICHTNNSILAHSQLALYQQLPVLVNTRGSPVDFGLPVSFSLMEAFTWPKTLRATLQSLLDGYVFVGFWDWENSIIYCVCFGRSGQLSTCTTFKSIQWHRIFERVSSPSKEFSIEKTPKKSCITCFLNWPYFLLKITNTYFISFRAKN